MPRPGISLLPGSLFIDLLLQRADARAILPVYSRVCFGGIRPGRVRAAGEYDYRRKLESEARGGIIAIVSLAWFKPLDNEEELLEFIRLAY